MPNSRCAVLASALLLALPTLALAQQQGTLEVATSVDSRTTCGAVLKASGLLLVPASGGPPIEFRTDFDGKAVTTAPVGDYELVTRDTVRVKGDCITWRVPLHLDRGTKSVTLTNANATLVRARLDTTIANVDAMQAAVKRWGASLVTVVSGRRVGTGLVVDRSGLVLTSVRLAEQDYVLVWSTPVQRMRARVVARDSALGLALLLGPPSLVADRAPADLGAATPPAAGVPGTAVGRLIDAKFELSRGLVRAADGPALTVELAMAALEVDGGVFVADDASLVGLVAAQPRDRCSTPVPNVVTAASARAFLERWGTAAAGVVPDTTLLPPWHIDSFSAHVLDSIVNASPDDKYAALDAIDAGRFTLWLESAPHDAVSERIDDAETRKDIERWKSKAKKADRACWAAVEPLPPPEPITHPAPAIVRLHVRPKVNMSGGKSIFFIPVQQAGIHVQGDLGAAVFFRDGERVQPLVGGEDVQVRRLFTPQGEWADSSHTGEYLLSPRLFAPAANGAPPTIAVHLTDLRHPTEPVCVVLPPAALAVLWNDFLRVYEGEEPAPVRADPKAQPPTPRPAAGQACPGLPTAKSR